MDFTTLTQEDGRLLSFRRCNPNGPTLPLNVLDYPSPPIQDQALAGLNSEPNRQLTNLRGGMAHTELQWSRKGCVEVGSRGDSLTGKPEYDVTFSRLLYQILPAETLQQGY